MSEREEYANGEFCWVELISPDVQAAARFYGDLLGWERERYEPDPEGYWYLRHAGKLVAGLEGIRMEGQVPAWLGYVKVDDVRATAGKVGEAGGTVLDGPLEVPGGAGSLAVCQDPDGAVFALWQPGELRGAELVNEPGAWTWTADQAVEKTKAAGGSLIYGPVDLPIARMAVAFDPQGANVSLLESRYPEPR